MAVWLVTRCCIEIFRVRSAALTNGSRALWLLGIMCYVHHSHTILPVYWYPFRGSKYVNLRSFQMWSRVMIPSLLWVFTGAENPATSVFDVEFWYSGLWHNAPCIYRRSGISCCFYLQHVSDFRFCTAGISDPVPHEAYYP
jgi:hypothetical protein